jgi:hypothetical protein
MWWMWTTVALGQAYEAQPCEASSALVAELAAGSVSQITPRGPGFVMAIASSRLEPSASATLDPAAVRAKYPGLELGDDDGYPGLAVADALSCTYGATNLLDGDPTTAWCESAAGDGVGEVVVFALPSTGALEIRNGYGKSAERYRQNGRARRVEVVLLGQGYEPAVQGTMHAAMPVLGRHEVELADLDGWQALPLPTWADPKPSSPPGPPGVWQAQAPRFAAIRVLSTYAGERWQDTCLSEVR